MKITDSSFNVFLNERILSLPSYLDSSKRMSFSFRDGKENQNIFAYASLKDEAINGQKGVVFWIILIATLWLMSDSLIE